VLTCKYCAALLTGPCLLQEAPAGWVVTRHIRSRGLSQAAAGVCLFKAEVQYTLGPGTDAMLSAEPHPTPPEPEVLHVYAFSAPAHMLEEALAARRGPRGARGLFFKRKHDAPSLTGMSGPGGARPSWSQAANELQREIAEDVLTHTCSAVFEDASPGGGRGAPAIKPALRRASSIILAGHSAGALVAYQTTLALLRHYPDELATHVKCVTFGMPVMGWDGREQRDCLLRRIAPTLTSIPLLRRDLPCPHFLHILRQEDVVPASSLCARKVRSSVAAALAIAAHCRTAVPSRVSSVSPYSQHYIDSLVQMGGDDTTDSSGGGMPVAEDEKSPSSPGFPAPTRQYDSDDEKTTLPLPADYGADGSDEAQANGDMAQTSGWGWKGWKKKDLLYIKGSSVDWNMLAKVVRDDVTDVSLPEWWPLGKFWFFCDSDPLEGVAARVDYSPRPASLEPAHQQRAQQATGAKAAHRLQPNHGTSPASTRRDGTVVRVRRWVVQFPYLIHATPSGKRELFEPFPDSVGLLRDMLSAAVHTLQSTPKQYRANERELTNTRLRRRHWPVHHHMGQYINALHSWVGSSEWQISRRRELACSLSAAHASNDTRGNDTRTNDAHPLMQASPSQVSPARPDANSTDVQGRSGKAMGDHTSSLLEVAACQPDAHAAHCTSVMDGVRTVLHLEMRGNNLHFVEAVEIEVYCWPVALGEQVDCADGLTSFSSPNTRSPAHEVSGVAEDASIKIWMQLDACSTCSSRLVATCDAPYGWIGSVVEARLLGSCIRELRLECDMSRLSSFRAMHGAAAALENAPVCALLQQALLLQDLVSLHTQTHPHLQSDGAASPSVHRRPLEHDTGRGRGRRGVEYKHCTQLVLLGDVTGPETQIATVDMASPSGVEVVEELVAELMNLEHKTRSQWTDFMRTISLGGLDPHANRAWSSAPSSSSVTGEGAAWPGSPDSGVHVDETVANEGEGELLAGRSSIKCNVRALLQVRGQQGRQACLEHIDELLSRPLSLSMDRSPRLKQMMGLTMAMTAGATIMAGSCLLAPYAAASMMPAVAAYVTPAHAVTGMFATSMVGTHMQARCTIDGSYIQKLQHFAAALRIHTANIRPVLSHCSLLSSISLSPLHISCHVYTFQCMSSI